MSKQQGPGTMPDWTVWAQIARWQAAELNQLLSHIEAGVESEISRRHELVVEYENTPLEPSESYYPILELEARHDALYTAAVHYRFWAYGGYLVTVLSWLNDQLLWLSDIGAHPSHHVFLEKHGEPAEPAREPSLSSLVKRLFASPGHLSSRILAWVDLRNRFVHSLGVVVQEEERDRLSKTLDIDFGDDGRMHLTAELCRAVLDDSERIVLAAVQTLSP